jgi:hypothetical protein
MSAAEFAPVAALLLISATWLVKRGRAVGYLFGSVALLALARAAGLL